MKSRRTRQPLNIVTVLCGSLLPAAIWIAVKYGFHVEDRYLPGPWSVFTAYRDISPSIFVHTGWSLGRLVTGGVAGALGGIGLAILMNRIPTLGRLLAPLVQSLRSVPAVATIPFFIVWFGFSETGRFILIFLAVGLNVLIAARQILEEMPEKYRIALLSFGHAPNSFPRLVSLPMVLERILPTLRTSLAIAFGAALIAESLGAQVGLGYLIDTSNSNYSMHTIFLATIVIGVANACLDSGLVCIWGRIAYWRKDRRLQKAL